jgi:hypothetical protein
MSPALFASLSLGQAEPSFSSYANDSPINCSPVVSPSQVRQEVGGLHRRDDEDADKKDDTRDRVGVQIGVVVRITFIGWACAYLTGDQHCCNLTCNSSKQPARRRRDRVRVFSSFFYRGYYHQRRMRIALFVTLRSGARYFPLSSVVGGVDPTLRPNSPPIWISPGLLCPKHHEHTWRLDGLSIAHCLARSKIPHLAFEGRKGGST